MAGKSICDKRCKNHVERRTSEKRQPHLLLLLAKQTQCVIHDSEAPINIANKLGKQSGKLIVCWDGNYSSLPENKIELLGQNKIDEFRANRSAKISKAYHLAVAELIDE